MTYQAWEARGHVAGNAEAATVVMGWRRSGPFATPLR